MVIRVLVVVVAALGALSGWLWLKNGWVEADKAALAAEVASLNRSIVTLETQAKQSRDAAEVAKATAAREMAVSQEYEKLRDTLRNGGNDEDLPCWFSDYINDVLGRVRNCQD